MSRFFELLRVRCRDTAWFAAAILGATLLMTGLARIGFSFGLESLERSRASAALLVAIVAAIPLGAEVFSRGAGGSVAQTLAGSGASRALAFAVHTCCVVLFVAVATPAVLAVGTGVELLPLGDAVRFTGGDAVIDDSAHSRRAFALLGLIVAATASSIWRSSLLSVLAAGTALGTCALLLSDAQVDQWTYSAYWPLPFIARRALEAPTLWVTVAAASLITSVSLRGARGRGDSRGAWLRAFRFTLCATACSGVVLATGVSRRSQEAPVEYDDPSAEVIACVASPTGERFAVWLAVGDWPEWRTSVWLVDSLTGGSTLALAPSAGLSFGRLSAARDSASHWSADGSHLYIGSDGLVPSELLVHATTGAVSRVKAYTADRNQLWRMQACGLSGDELPNGFQRPSRNHRILRLTHNQFLGLDLNAESISLLDPNGSVVRVLRRGHAHGSGNASR